MSLELMRIAPADWRELRATWVSAWLTRERGHDMETAQDRAVETCDHGLIVVAGRWNNYTRTTQDRSCPGRAHSADPQ